MPAPSPLPGSLIQGRISLSACSLPESSPSFSREYLEKDPPLIYALAYLLRKKNHPPSLKHDGEGIYRVCALVLKFSSRKCFSLLPRPLISSHLHYTLLSFLLFFFSFSSFPFSLPFPVSFGFLVLALCPSPNPTLLCLAKNGKGQGAKRGLKMKWKSEERREEKRSSKGKGKECSRGGQYDEEPL